MSPATAFGRLQGQVLAPDRTPAGGAHLWLDGLASRSRTRTAADGSFSFAMVGAGQVGLRVRAGEQGERSLLTFLAPGCIRRLCIELPAAGDADPQVLLRGAIYRCTPVGAVPLQQPAELLVYDPATGTLLDSRPLPPGELRQRLDLPAGVLAFQVEGVPGHRATFQILNIAVAPAVQEIVLDFYLLPGDPDAPPVENPGQCPPSGFVI